MKEKRMEDGREGGRRGAVGGGVKTTLLWVAEQNGEKRPPSGQFPSHPSVFALSHQPFGEISSPLIYCSSGGPINQSWLRDTQEKQEKPAKPRCLSAVNQRNQRKTARPWWNTLPCVLVLPARSASTLCASHEIKNITEIGVAKDSRGRRLPLLQLCDRCESCVGVEYIAKLTVAFHLPQNLDANDTCPQ